MATFIPILKPCLFEGITYHRIFSEDDSRNLIRTEKCPETKYLHFGIGPIDEHFSAFTYPFSRKTHTTLAQMEEALKRLGR